MAPESSMENQAQVTTPNMANRQSPVARESSEVRSGIDTRSGIPVTAQSTFTHVYTQEGQFIQIGAIKRLLIGPNEAGNACVFAEMDGPVPMSPNPKEYDGNVELRRNIPHEEAVEYAQHFMQPGIDFVYCDLGNEYVNPMFASEFDYVNRPYFVIE